MHEAKEFRGVGTGRQRRCTDAPGAARSRPPEWTPGEPFEGQIKAGGAVNFVISGFHILAIYGPGTALDDVSGGVTIPIPLAPPGFPQVVNDPLNRVYWGVNPFSLVPPPVPPSPVSVVPAPLDRVEAVTFSVRGTYLVICAFVPHFLDKMHGFVKVLP
jgi:hypothetical protein